MSAWEEHRADSQARTNTLVELMPEDQGGETVVFRASLFPFTSGPADNPPDTPFPIKLESVPTFEASTIPLGSASRVLRDTGEGEIVLGQSGELDSAFAPGRYRWAGRWARVLRGGFTPTSGHEMALSEYSEVARFRMGAPLRGLDRVRIPVRQPAKDLERRLVRRRFRGTTGALLLAAGERVQLGAPAHLVGLTGDLTVEAWVWLGDVESNRRILSWPGASSFPFHLVAKMTSAVVSWRRTGFPTFDSSIDLAIRQWHHVSVICQGSETTIRVWSPSSRQERVETKQVGAGPGQAANGTLEIGRSANGHAGMVEELRIWSTARTERQIRRLRSRPLTSVESEDGALAGYWPLDVDASDASPHANHGTLVGGVFVSSLQGGEDSEDVSMPEAWGAPENAPAYELDGVRQIYCVGSGLIKGVVAAYDSAAAIGQGPTHSDLRDFLTQAPGAGTYSTFSDVDGAWIRLGSKPSGRVTVDLEGYTDEKGNLLSTASQISRHMLAHRGPFPLADPAELDTESFDALETANPAPLEYFVPAGDERTVAAAVSSVLLTVGAYGWFEGVLFHVERFEGVTAELPSAQISEANLGGAALEPLPVDLRPWKAVLWYRRAYVVQTGKDVVLAVQGTPRAFFVGKAFRRAADHDRTIRDDHRQGSVVLELETHFTRRADALAEAARLLALFRDAEGYLLPAVDESGRGLSRLRMVDLSYREGDGQGGVVDRLGLPGKFVILGSGSREAGPGEAVTLKIWRQVGAA